MSATLAGGYFKKRRKRQTRNNRDTMVLLMLGDAAILKMRMFSYWHFGIFCCLLYFAHFILYIFVVFDSGILL